jgi:hypothetical protein
MKQSYLHNLMPSFYLWLDHEMLYKGGAFLNYSGKLYNIIDPTFSQNTIYSSPWRQWVSDTSVSGAIVPSGIYANGNFIPRDTSGLGVDFIRGRAVFNNNVKTNINNLTVNTSFKEFNIYYTDEKDENLLFEKRYDPAPKVVRATGGLNWNDEPYPCIFYKNKTLENKPFAFGGEDRTESMIRCVILTENIYQLDGAISVMIDSARKVFPLITQDKLPYDINGDLKSGISYNYFDLVKNEKDFVYIDKVTVSRMSETENKKMNSKLVAALVDFELSDIRTPRI